MESLGTLVAGVAHEINNPINLIMFNVPLIQKIWNDFQPVLNEYAGKNPDRKYGGLTYNFLEENLSKLISDMDLATNRVAKIVTDLKNFARQADIADRSPVLINTAVENAMRLSGTFIKKSGVDLKVDLGTDIPLIEGNLQGLEHITLNLIINAIEAIDHEHGRVRVSTGIHKGNGRIFLSVSDNGRGINPSLSDTIFDPFVTDRQLEGGTGMGLSTTYSLVKTHNGEITYESQKGKGTTFRAVFPTRPDEQIIKILLADDDEAARKMIIQALGADRPYVVEEAANGTEACVRLGTFRPDLLILDLFMPEMDGLEVCRAIRAEPDLSEMGVLLITGFPEDAKVHEIADLGFAHVCAKPVKILDLRNAVDKILR